MADGSAQKSPPIEIMAIAVGHRGSGSILVIVSIVALQSL
jgi:hypothetical protein